MGYNCGLSEQDFFRLYHPQRGGTIGADGTLFFKSSFGRQHGSGIGGIFGAIGRRLLPFLKNVIWPHAKRALRNVAVDVVDNDRPWQDSLKSNGMEALKGIGSSVLSQSGSGIRRKRRSVTNPKLKKKKAKYSTVKRKLKKKSKAGKKRTVKRKPKFVSIFN
jgi:hypothetical protein